MTSETDRKLSELKREISKRQHYIEGEQVLIEVLERDGHDVLDRVIALKTERSTLAIQISRQFELMRQTED
jgi:hypothetical protein